MWALWENIRKFGLDHNDLPTMLWNITAIFRLVALDIDPRNKKPISILAVLFLLFIVTCYYYVYVVSMIWFVFWRCSETGEVHIAIIIFSLTVTSQISVTKLLWMFAHRNKLRQMLEAFLSCDALVAPNSRFSKNLKVKLRLVKRRAIIIWVLLMSNGLAYILMNLLKPGRHLIDDEFVFLGLEPMIESPNYEIAIIVNIYAVFANVYSSGGIAAFFIIISGYIEGQMLALSDEVTRLWEDALKDYEELFPRETKRKRELKINAFIKKRLEGIVKVHATNVNLVKQMENIFRGAIALQFLFLVVGLITCLLAGLENTYIALPFALILVGTDCLTGQRIRDASVTFERAIYDSKWENFDVANRKIVLLMLQNAQKNMVLSAGGVATLSLECLMGIARMTYSAYTTLRSTIVLHN